MRRVESPIWGSEEVELWLLEMVDRMESGEVARVTFSAVWRGGVRRRLLVNSRASEHLFSCETAMHLAQQWEPPADRVQARLWGPGKRYISATTWQIGARKKPRPLKRGEQPQLPQPQGQQPIPPEALEEHPALPEIVERLMRLEAANNQQPTFDAVGVLSLKMIALEQRLEAAEQQLRICEQENRRLKNSIVVVWKELSEQVFGDVYERLQAIYDQIDMSWIPVRDTLSLPQKWPNVDHKPNQ